MRIVDWTELSTLPPGTIYQGVAEYDVGDLKILGAVWSYGGKASELVSASLLPTSWDVESLSLTKEEEARAGVSRRDVVVIHPSGHGREHAASGNRRWLVWEQADRERLARWLLDPEAASSEQNSDDYAVILKVRDPA